MLSVRAVSYLSGPGDVVRILRAACPAQQIDVFPSKHNYTLIKSMSRINPKLHCRQQLRRNPTRKRAGVKSFVQVIRGLVYGYADRRRIIIVRVYFSGHFLCSLCFCLFVCISFIITFRMIIAVLACVFGTLRLRHHTGSPSRRLV